MGMGELLRSRRFGPLFWVQFLAAFNDNVFKQGLVILVAFKAASEGESAMLSTLASGLLVLPFFLASATAGQLCDKLEKSRLVLWIKLGGLVIMGVGLAGFITESVPLLFLCLFLTGVDAALFGPVKYSILPQLVKGPELIAANALIEGATFCAIILGLVVGGVLFSVGVTAVGIGTVVTGLLTVGAAWLVPQTSAADPNLVMKWNPVKETRELTRLAKKERSVYFAIVAISWFWFLGATVLAQFPTFAQYYLHGSPSVYTLLMGVFSVAVGIGSLIAVRASQGEVEMGFVPLAALGMSVFLTDVFFIPYPEYSGPLVTASQLLGGELGTYPYRALFDFFMVGFFGGFYNLPLYAMMQKRSDPRYRSRIIAANNVLNAVYMVVSALATMLLLKAGMTVKGVFGILAILNIGLSLLVFYKVPEFYARLPYWLRATFGPGVTFVGRENIPERGPGVLVAVRCDDYDAFVLTAAARREIAMLSTGETAFLPRLFARFVPRLPWDGTEPDAAALRDAFEQGRLVAVVNDSQSDPRGSQELLARILGAYGDHPLSVVPITFQRSETGQTIVTCGEPVVASPGTASKVTESLRGPPSLKVVR